MCINQRFVLVSSQMFTIKETSRILYISCLFHNKHPSPTNIYTQLSHVLTHYFYESVIINDNSVWSIAYFKFPGMKMRFIYSLNRLKVIFNSYYSIPLSKIRLSHLLLLLSLFEGNFYLIFRANG